MTGSRAARRDPILDGDTHSGLTCLTAPNKERLDIRSHTGGASVQRASSRVRRLETPLTHGPGARHEHDTGVDRKLSPRSPLLPRRTVERVHVRVFGVYNAHQ